MSDTEQASNEGEPQKAFIDQWLKKMYASIPDYQRGYSWEHDQIEDFMTDLRDESNKKSEYFFGPIVTVEQQDKKQRKQVIDGQQRITTIMICLAVMRDILVALSNSPVDPAARKVAKILEAIGGEDPDDPNKPVKFGPRIKSVQVK